MSLLPDSCSLLEHIKFSAQIGQAFGYPPSESVDLVPLPGECLWMASPCHEPHVDEHHCDGHAAIVKAALMTRVAEAVLIS